MYSIDTYSVVNMKEKKVEVVIKTNSGVELKIESDRETVQEIVAEIHRREVQRARFREDFMKRRDRFLEHVKKNREESKNFDKKRSFIKTRKDIILELMRTPFFDEPKQIGDIQKAMAERGYHYPTTSLSPLLIRLVRQGFLVRSRDEKDWKYVRKGD